MTSPYRPLHSETPEQARIRILEEQLSGVRDVVKRMRVSHDEHTRSLRIMESIVSIVAWVGIIWFGVRGLELLVEVLS